MTSKFHSRDRCIFAVQKSLLCHFSISFIWRSWKALRMNVLALKNLFFKQIHRNGVEYSIFGCTSNSDLDIAVFQRKLYHKTKVWSDCPKFFIYPFSQFTKDEEKSHLGPILWHYNSTQLFPHFKYADTVFAKLHLEISFLMN